ncbi:MAG TPA: tyrosine/phenylalanine carboxypeptidase domain-containing protein [Coriobacteriia bacterium]|nr:tyrosine/phenylalanine carboxypeptidase domain-containing protein [Coriobacteriia bacterium]
MIEGALLDTVLSRVDAGLPVRRAMPVWGRLHIDRPLPFLMVYRRPVDRPDAGTERCVTGTASYLQVTGAPEQRTEVARLIESVSARMSAVFGAFLVVEVWAVPFGPHGVSEACPGFRVIAPADGTLDPTAAELARALGEQRVMRRAPHVETVSSGRVAAAGMRPLLSGAALERCGASLVGLEIEPVYRSEGGTVFPGVHRQVQRAVTTSLDRASYRFSRTRTAVRFAHYHQLSRRSVVRAVFEIDRRLAAIGDAFDVLLQVTPVDAEAAFSAFRRSRYQRMPAFHYRPLPMDPGHLKHQLWAVRTERVEDPTLMYLLREKQVELDRQLTLLADIDSPAFRLGSMLLYRAPDADLVALAERILAAHPRARERGELLLSADEFRALAAAEIAEYRTKAPDFGAPPQVRKDIYTGMLVSKGRLYIGETARIAHSRADSLIQHEIGTHVLTHHNGSLQPLRLLAVGLPGYEAQQEGLAVLAEYLSGGLDPGRLRILAARVLAVDALVAGAEFVDVFRLVRARGFSQRASYTVAARVFRGGGFTKDAMYLHGLVGILRYVREGGEFERLFVGKFSTAHAPVIDELLMRGIISPAAVQPRYLDRGEVRRRLERLRADVTVTDLVEG